MDFLKIQSEILKGAYNRLIKDKEFDWQYCETDQSVVMGNAFECYIIPKQYVFLNIEKTFDRPPLEGFKTIIQGSETTHFVEDTGIEKHLPDSNIAVHIFDCGEGEELWINVKLLKRFDLKKCVFKGNNRKTPLFIYENDVLVGIVIGINHNS